MNYAKEIIPKIIHYHAYRMGLASPGKPFNFTFSVTNLCQSKCKTCYIWDLYRKHPEKFALELTLDEIETIFKKLGHVYIFNVSGGEPFLRKDFVSIIKAACRYLTPGIIHIPTNAIAVNRVEKQTLAILELMQKMSPQTQLTVKPSLDHIGGKHDEIRGTPGNFPKVIELFHRLKKHRKNYPNFHVELGSVISRWNVGDISQIADYVTQLGADSYRNEIAEQRSEMFNTGNRITPNAEQYEKAIRLFVQRIRRNMRDKILFQRITNAFRLVYYDLAIRILKENRQIIPCFGGISNAHMTPYGDIWACCTLGYDHSMGNLRDFDYDFKVLWNSPQAKKVRKHIRSRKCTCPLANQTYSNILLDIPSLLRVFKEIIAPGI